MFNNLPNVYTFDPMIKTFWGGLCAIVISILLASPLAGQSPPSASLLTQAVQQREFEKASRIAYELGSMAWSNNEQEEAKKYLIQSLTYAKRAGTSVQSFYAVSFLAKIYYETDDFNNSADFYERSAVIAEELGYRDAAIENYVRQGEALARLKRYKKAVAPTENAL